MKSSRAGAVQSRNSKRPSLARISRTLVEETTCRAPRRSAASRLSGDEVNAVVSQPRARRNLIARCPSPPMPITPTCAPAATPQRRSGANTVTPAHRSGAAAAASSDSGNGNTNRPSRRMRRANPPMCPTQVASCRAQRFSSPARHCSQSKQADRCQPTPTRWPAASRQRSPAAVTVPTISWPGTSG